MQTSTAPIEIATVYAYICNIYCKGKIRARRQEIMHFMYNICSTFMCAYLPSILTIHYLIFICFV